MSLPSALSQAVAHQGGGRIALVLGAGCSIEPPTCLPASIPCSEEIHRQLVEDGVLVRDECPNPADLSAVADAVHSKLHSQREVVARLRDRYDLRTPKPNEGYLIAAALLAERAVSAIVTLNYDLALSNAIAELGVGTGIGIIERPEHLGTGRQLVNVYYLHRNVNDPDPEAWVLRSAALLQEWKGHWEQIISTTVLTTPVVVFAGLGSRIGVLESAVQLLRTALPNTTSFFQFGYGDPTNSDFFRSLNIDTAAYLPDGWCECMRALSARLLEEQFAHLILAISEQTARGGIPAENTAGLERSLRRLGLLGVGRVRGHWCLDFDRYRADLEAERGLFADLLLALALVERTTTATLNVLPDGQVELSRNGLILARLFVATGHGHRTKSKIEATLQARRHSRRHHSSDPNRAIVAGTSDHWAVPLSPPKSVVRGDPEGSVVDGPEGLSLIHVSHLRQDPTRIPELVL